MRNAGSRTSRRFGACPSRRRAQLLPSCVVEGVDQRSGRAQRLGTIGQVEGELEPGYSASMMRRLELYRKTVSGVRKSLSPKSRVGFCPVHNTA